MCLNPKKHLVPMIGPLSRLIIIPIWLEGERLEMEVHRVAVFDSDYRDSNGQGGHLNPGSPALMSPGQPGWESGFQPTATSSCPLHHT